MALKCPEGKAAGDEMEVNVPTAAHRSRIKEIASEALHDLPKPVIEKRQKLEKELSMARMQTSKWSLLSFVLNPEIQAFTKQGESLRQTLKAVWVLNSGNVEVLEYLGDELTKKAKDFVFV